MFGGFRIKERVTDREGERGREKQCAFFRGGIKART